MCFLSLYVGFQLTCATDILRSGSPGTTFSVDVVPGYPQSFEPVSLFYTLDTVSTTSPVTVTVPASGSRTYSVRAFGFGAGGVQDECTISIIVTGNYIYCNREWKIVYINWAILLLFLWTT